MGTLFMQIYDDQGQVLQAGRKYVVKRQSGGGAVYQGTLSSQATLRHDFVPPDHYVVAVDGMEECPAIMLDSGDTQPQVRYLSEV